MKKELDRTRLAVNDEPTGTPYLRLGLNFGLFVEQNRVFLVHDHVLADNAFFDVIDRWQIVHDVYHAVFHNGPQASGAGLTLDSFLGNSRQRGIGKPQVNALHLEHFLVLLDESVLRLFQYPDQGILV